MTKPVRPCIRKPSTLSTIVGLVVLACGLRVQSCREAYRQTFPGEVMSPFLLVGEVWRPYFFNCVLFQRHHSEGFLTPAFLCSHSLVDMVIITELVGGMGNETCDHRRLLNG